MNNDVIEPMDGFMHPHDNEIFTYVTRKTEHKDSLGNGSTIHLVIFNV